MNYNFDVGDNITITDEFSLWLDNLKKENIEIKEKLSHIKESIEFSKEFNVEKNQLIDNIERIIDEL